MNRALSILALLPIANFAATGCSGSSGTTDVSPTVADPSLASGSDAGSAGGGPASVCGGAGCAPLTMSSLCGIPHTTLIKDGLAPDDAANAVIQDALIANCNPPPMESTLEKGVSGSIDPTTGRPTSGPHDLLTIAGGSFVQKTVAYLDLTGATPVYLIANDSTHSWQYVSRAPGGPIVAEMPYSAFSVAHDIILIELVRDAASGTPVLIAFGQEAESTAAAARYIAHELLPNASHYEKSWYAYEWTAADDAAEPSTYSPKASGP